MSAPTAVIDQQSLFDTLALDKAADISSTEGGVSFTQMLRKKKLLIFPLEMVSSFSG